MMTHTRIRFSKAWLKNGASVNEIYTTPLEKWVAFVDFKAHPNTNVMKCLKICLVIIYSKLLCYIMQKLSPP